ncbi:chemotaxis protein CheW [Herbivorax sp. ANBcel31]|uniref:chemotaxis protein CheA n=1 Tax=Herbivorax sp. ANBcel31 TaxID=3069754 RepID=UPI0027B5AB00|nr:chemotaxis protein CheW [Herbivorax sp. ANBcel31]MDQ2084913.1 chemotaxis protein CheW [Herbivorax sp. ANBcel31]
MSEQNREVFTNSEKEKSQDEILELYDEVIIEVSEHVENIENICLKIDKSKEKIELIDDLFRSFHSIKGLAGFINQSLIAEIAHKTETLLDLLKNIKVVPQKGCIDIILMAADKIVSICRDNKVVDNNIFIKTVEELFEKLYLKQSEVNNLLQKSTKNKEADGLKKQQSDNEKLKKRKENNKKNVSKDLSENKNTNCVEYLKVMPEDIDFLSELMGEIIITQSVLEREMENRVETNENFFKEFMEMSKATINMQNLIMSLGMVPLKANFNKLKKVADETIKELGKNIHLKVTGENTEMERDLAEKITDPLMHIVKNSISHGIESKEERIEKGKDECGTVNIEAYTKSESVYIEISDDGGGINLEKVLKKAINKKLVNPDIEYSNEEILDFLFMPGFSTSESVNSISGRGVGLDVVKTEIAKIGGKVEIHNNPGKGCTFVVKTPLNLAVLDGVVVNIDKEKFIIPTTYLKKVLKWGEYSWIKQQGNKNMVKVKEEIIPLLPREKIFGLKEKKEEGDLCILLLQIRREKRAIAVEGIDERRKLAVKSLDNVYYNPSFVMGASILEDGRASFIVDVESIFRNGG